MEAEELNEGKKCKQTKGWGDLGNSGALGKRGARNWEMGKCVKVVWTAERFGRGRRQ